MLRQVDPNHYYRFKFHTFKNYLENKRKFCAPADPYKRITIKPKNIDYRLRRYNDSLVIPKPKYGGLSQVSSGEWDKRYKSIEDCSDPRGAIIKSFRQRYCDQRDWKDTAYYKSGITEFKNKSEKNNISLL